MFEIKEPRNRDIDFLSKNEREQLTLLGALHATLLHEIKNQLSCFMIGCDILKRDQELLSKDSQIALLSVRAAADRMQFIIRDFGTLLNGDQVPFSPVVLNQIIESALQSAKREPNHINVSLQLNAIPNVMGSAMRLEQLFLNLILNALHAMTTTRPLSVLSIRTYSTPNNVIVEIIDTGCGFAPETLDQLFKPFITTRRDTGGTGLGMWICKLIADEHGATLHVKSELGKGTTVEVSFPKS